MRLFFHFCILLFGGLVPSPLRDAGPAGAARPGRDAGDTPLTGHRESFTRNAELPESPRAPAAPAVCLSCDTGHEPHRTVYNTGATLRFITGTAVTVRPYDRGLTAVHVSALVRRAGGRALRAQSMGGFSNPRVGVDRDQLDLVQQARIRWHAALRQPLAPKPEHLG